MKVGDVYVCECGAEFTVTRACECDDCQPRCCDKPMKLQGAEQPKSEGGCCCSG